MKIIKITVAIFAAVLTFAVLSVSLNAAPYVAYWSFDENAVEMVNGYTPGNPEAYKPVDGKNGKAYQGALEDHSGVIIYDNVNIPFVSSFTCTVWAKGDYNIEAGSYYVMMAKNQKATDGHFEFYWNPNGNFSIYSTNKDMVSLLESKEALDDGQWHHYVIRVEENEWELYVDGVLDVTYSAKEPLIIAEGPMFFGSLVDSTLYAQSALDDLMFLDYAIDPADIPAVMSDTKAYAESIAGVPASAAPEAGTEQPEAAPEVEKTPQITAAVTAPQTSDSIVILAVAVLISLTATSVLRKKSGH